ncbi:hypothetical protein SLEP1_g44661 [Rubroshorea leprosula]|uniref:Uncharacterized protein n=1 Tax=Rubroshorea leprosula TaxID=152421 RepID=A0AAV5LHE4_9ROSI|nr:hypothetical protein SLEP1_g44661 [Rubroshorea leprosula]
MYRVDSTTHPIAGIGCCAGTGATCPLLLKVQGVAGVGSTFSNKRLVAESARGGRSWEHFQQQEACC